MVDRGIVVRRMAGHGLARGLFAGHASGERSGGVVGAGLDGRFVGLEGDGRGEIARRRGCG